MERHTIFDGPNLRSLELALFGDTHNQQQEIKFTGGSFYATFPEKWQELWVALQATRSLHSGRDDNTRS